MILKNNYKNHERILDLGNAIFIQIIIFKIMKHTDTQQIPVNKLHSL